MKIYPASSEIFRSGETREVERTPPPTRDKDLPHDAGSAVPRRNDKVQISDAGRALAAQGSENAHETLTPERIAEVRERIMSGAYNSLEVVDQVARRMLASGDI